jgi:HCOMODA/2-hydroxy-3-carboxy-muconic semialdehyde decarboxylase
MASGTLFLWGCSSESRPAETDSQAAGAAQSAPQSAPRPEQALLEDLVVANRILAREAGILDIQGHTSVRSRSNPNHWYQPKFVSPGGASVEDMIEYDVDAKEVLGPRNDNAREIYLHASIYKARPDVMAVVHAHTPEFVAFGMTTVPLLTGAGALPVWDIRPFNRGRNGIVSTPALAQAMAEKLGGSEAVLLWGHGIAFTGKSLPEAVHGVIELRRSAQLQQAAITMGSTWKPEAARDAGDAERAWQYLKRVDLKPTGGKVPAVPAPTPAKPSDPDEAAKHDLVLANRILASAELGILHSLGHVSIRSPRNANTYFVASGVSAGAVTANDVMTRDVASGEASIDSEIYKARPDVMAVLYARTPEVVAFTEGVKLRPVVNGGAFIGDGLPVLMGGPDPKQIANALGKQSGVLLAGHGYVLTSRSIYNLVDQAYALRMNATIQQQAVALRGKVTYLNEVLPSGEPAGEGEGRGEGRGRGGRGGQAQGQGGPTLGPPEGRAWVYWSQNVSLD